jgi:hypothetical protein
MTWKDTDRVTTTYGSIQLGQAQAAEAERERIIKLLTPLAECIECAESDPVEDCNAPVVADIIALIRAEQSDASNNTETLQSNAQRERTNEQKA